MIISGKEIASRLKDELRDRVAESLPKYGRVPCIALVLVGDDVASSKYVRGKKNDAEAIGMTAKVMTLPASISEEELIGEVQTLNADDSVDAIMVQLPLPAGICEDRVIAAIDPDKDADGLHPLNVAALWNGTDGIAPCTPKGIMRMIDHVGVNPEGKHVVVMGRSCLVGLPVSKMLLDRNATVTHVHSFTRDKASITSGADILVVAIGDRRFVTADMVKPGAVVIDVGISWDGESGKVVGDVDFDAVAPKAGAITPVPGGVGPMTKACLMENTFECYERRMAKKAADCK